MKSLFYLILIFFISSVDVWSQVQKDTLNTEEIEVVKPYTPTIMDAFKINEVPIDSEDILQKEVIQYEISSVPVASTFVPTKGKVKKIVPSEKSRLYDNFISIGLGNYSSPLLDLFIRTYPERNTEAGLILNHHSSAGQINKVILDSRYSDTKGKIYYSQDKNDMYWKMQLGVERGLYNYYGVFDDSEYDPEYLNSIDPSHNFTDIAVNGEVRFNSSFLKGGNLLMSSISDNFNSNEQRLKITPKFLWDLSSEKLEIDVDFDYLNGNFKRLYTSEENLRYQFFNLGLSPSFVVLRENLTLNLGAKIYRTSHIQLGTAETRFFPNINFSYALIPNVMNFYVGATGGVHYNTYSDYLQENPFLSPTFNTIPTVEKFALHAGLKGKIAEDILFVADVRYKDVQNFALLRLNDSKYVVYAEDYFPYILQNSFDILFDNANIFQFSGDLILELNENFDLGGRMNMFIYDLEYQKYAWNKPTLRTEFTANYHNQKWMAIANLFMNSERRDLVFPENYDGNMDNNNIEEVGAFVDLNAHASYSFTHRLSAFAKANNILNTQYKRFYNYPVQGFKIYAGITYKFDL